MDDPGVRPLLPRQLRRRELIALDAVVAAGYLVIALIGPVTAASGLPAWLRWIVVVGIVAPIVVRRLWPVPALGVVLAASAAAMWLGVLRDPLLATGYVLYPVAVREPRRRREPTVAIGVASLVGLVGISVVGFAPADGDGTGETVGLIVLCCVLLGGVWTVGRAVRERRAYAARAAERAAGRAVAEERLRIARELHDIVSHTLSLIGVKAAVANHVADSRPEEVRDALRVIEATSRDALTEMRRMLGVLRADQPAGSLWDEPPAAVPRPAPGLAGLPELAERARTAGIRVDVRLHEVAGLPQGVELSAYRIVQEALTNVVRHAAPASCQVTIDGRGDQVLISVTDDGRGPRSAPAAPAPADGEDRPALRGQPGHGLIGMRERVLVHGGTFRAGPRRGGGFQVLATLPKAAGGDPSCPR